MPWPALPWIIGGIVALFVGGLALAVIFDWFEDNKTPTSSHGELIKRKLANGDYKVVAGIFDKRGVRTASETWETNELDDELKDYFGDKHRVRVEL